MMKKLWYMLGLSALVFVGNYFYGMQKRKRSAPEDAPSCEVYFVPQDDVHDKLISFLDNAQKRVLVAAYLITEDSVVERLIELKRRRVDVQIIVDESSLNNSIDKLIRHGIVPLIYPSQTSEEAGMASGIMHNKFVVVDNDDVFTGSANFTYPALGTNSNNNNVNDENVVIIHSNDITQKYKQAFYGIQKNILNLYIQMIDTLQKIPKWFILLLRMLPKTRFDVSDQAKIESFLAQFESEESESTSSSSNPVSQGQREILRDNEYSDSEIDAMSYGEADDLIAALRDSRYAY